MKFNSVKFKISVLYVAILGIILIVYSSFLYLSLHYTLYDELDNELSNKAQEITSTINSYLNILGNNKSAFDFALKRAIALEGESPTQNRISELESLWLQKVDKLDLKEDYINFLDIKGQSVIKSNNLQGDMVILSSKEIKSLSEGNQVFKSIKFEKRNLRVVNAPFLDAEKVKFFVQVGTSLKPVIHLLQVRLTHIVISIPIILVLASFLGRLFSLRILRPVVEVIKTARNITHEDLSLRVKAEHVDQEMKYLVDAFNDMICRLEMSFKYIAEFSSHVAHELKTPLAIIRGESELALRKERTPEEYKRVIEINLEETSRMLKTIEDLLLLTKLDYSSEMFEFKLFNLTEFLKEIYEHSKILASGKGLLVEKSIPEQQINVRGNKLHLRRLFFNLVDNAIKFTPKEGKVSISAKLEDNKAIISISDTGFGIAKEDLPKIFDKFYRVDTRDLKSEPGTGLGLSIAQSIAKIHNANIEVKSELRKGSTFSIALPLT